MLYAKTLAGKLNPDLKANLNGHPSICHSIQIWIRLKKLYFHGKWQNHFTHRYFSTFTICRNFIWMKNSIYITIFIEKFPNQCKEKTNNKVPSNILILYKASSRIWQLSISKNKLGSQIILLFNFNTIPYSSKVCFRITSL